MAHDQITTCCVYCIRNASGMLQLSVLVYITMACTHTKIALVRISVFTSRRCIGLGRIYLQAVPGYMHLAQCVKGQDKY